MKDENRTKDQLIKELKELHQQIRDLKNFEVEHKRTEKVLLQCEERYRILAENPMNGIYISTESGFEYVNPAFEEICGYKSEELCSRDFNFLDLIHPDDKELVKKRKEAREKGKILPSIYEFRIITKEEEIRYVEVNTVSLLGERGKILGILRDITERKRAEDEYKKAQKPFSGIYNSSKDAIGYADLEGYILDVNSSFCSLTGYSRAEMLNGIRYQDLTPEEYHQYEAKVIERIFSTGKPEEYEKEYVRKDGSRVPVLLTTFIVRGNNGKPVGFAAIIKDITERKLTQEKLRESEEKYYRLIVETSPDAITKTDLDGRINYASQRTAEMHGYKESKELIGRSAFELIAPEEHEKAMVNLKSTMEEGIIRDVQFTFLRKDESRFPGELSSALLKDSSDKSIGFIALTRDITERKISEEKLKKQNLRNKLILQTALNGFFLLDRKGTILEANKSVAEIVGYPLQKIFGMNIRDLEENENAQEVKKYVNKVMKKGFDRFETKLWNKNGKIVELRVSTSFIDLEGNKFFFTFFHDITKSKITEQALRKRGEKELETKSSNLEEFNTALEVLLKKREEDKADLEKSILFNVEDLVVPYIEKLKKIGLSKKQGVYVGILENNLKKIISPFSRKLSTKYHKFTPAEIRVADLVRQGKRNKEIAEILNVSPRTAAFHRENIRKKLGIRKNKTNLTSYLSSLP